MAMCKDVAGFSLMEKSSSFLPCTKSVFLRHRGQGKPGLSPAPVNKKRAAISVKPMRGPVVAAVIEDVVVKSAVTKTQQFNVAAVVTVRRKIKEDLKGSILEQLDAWSEKLGRNVVLELVSTEIDPSKNIMIRSSLTSYYCRI